VSGIKSAADKTAFQLDLQNRFEAVVDLDTYGIKQCYMYLPTDTGERTPP